MKTLSFILLVIISFLYPAKSQEVIRFKPCAHESYLLSKGEYRYSLFSKAEYGLTDNITLSAHPLWIFIAPSIDIRWRWISSDSYSLSWIHGISCPTPAMNLFALEGTGGLISPEFDIPFMLALRNGVISTWKTKQGHTITSEFAVEFALLNDKLQPGSSIDIPVISPRNAVYYKNIGVDVALAAEGKIIGKFDYYSKAQAFVFPAKNDKYTNEYGETSRFFGEFSGLIFWNLSKKSKLGLGGRLCYGDYPFGTQWHLLPMIDFVRYVW
jgi:hypothetical protein